MRYKFKNHKIEVSNPVVIRLEYLDEYGASSMPVIATLQTSDGSKFGGIELGVFEYGKTYEDADVMAWAINELEKFKS